eukprot:scaffold9132_cov84-Skeletonema_dohrnii-CCMP3373.AAC.1
MTNLSESLDSQALWKLKGDRVPRPVGQCEQQLLLRGKFKGEDNLRWHLIPIVDSTRSNIPTRRWVSRLLKRRRVEEGQMEGLLFAKADGTPATLNLFDPTFRRLLERAREEHSRAFLVRRCWRTTVCADP